MKKDFWDYTLKVMEKNLDVYMISMGLGWPRTDELSTKYPQRFIQTEASEQTALDIAVGLAYSGKIPITYTITPFYYRAFETIRTYINKEKLHLIMIGAGRDEDYSKHDGYSHDAKDIKKILNTQENIWQYYPNSKEELIENLDEAIVCSDSPSFISIRR